MVSESQESPCRDGQGEGASAETPHPTCAGKALLGSEELSCCFPTLGTLQGLSAPREELHDAGHVLVGDAGFGKGLATRTVKTEMSPIASCCWCRESLGTVTLDFFIVVCLLLLLLCVFMCTHVSVHAIHVQEEARISFRCVP